MKKIVALALAVVMVLGLMAGCEKKESMDAKTLAQKMDEAMESVTAVAGKMGLDVEMKIGVTGMTMTMGMNVDADMKYKQDMSAGYYKMTFGVEAMGMNEKTEMEYYFITEDGKLVNYVYEPTMDMWLKTEQDIEEFRQQQMNLMSLTMKYSDIPEEKMTLAAKQETVDGKSCYVLSTSIDGSMFKDYMGTLMNTMTDEMDEESMAMLEKMDFSALVLDATYYVDASSFRVVQMTGEVKGLDAMMNSLLALAMEMGMDAGAENVEISVEVPKCSYTMTGMAYNDVEIPAIPQDAIDNAVSADDMVDDDEAYDDEYVDLQPEADGSYKLALGQNVVTIKVPEGLEVIVADEEMIVAMNEDMTNTASYVLFPGYTDEDVREDLEAGVELLKEMEMYESHSEREKINGFSVVEVIYADGTVELTAWLVTDDGALVVSISAEGTQPDLEAVLNAIVIGE